MSVRSQECACHSTSAITDRWLWRCVHRTWLESGTWWVVLYLNCIKNLSSSTVITFYSKTGGKHGKHGSITEASNISAVSYIGLQLFEFMHGRQFRHIPEVTSRLQTKQFALLPSMSFLCLLSVSPKVHSVSGTLELAQEDSDQFKTLDKGTAKFKDAMKLSRKRGKGAETLNDELSEED